MTHVSKTVVHTTFLMERSFVRKVDSDQGGGKNLA